MRYFTPAALFVAAIAVGVANQSGNGSAWTFPWELAFPSLAGDLVAQGQYTVVTLVAVAVVSFVRAWMTRNEGASG